MNGAIPRPFLLTLLAALLLASLAADIPGAPALKVPGPHGDLVLVESGGSYYLEGVDGGRLELPLAAPVGVTSLVTAGDDWFAAGVDPQAAEPLVLLRGVERRVAALSPPARQAAVVRSPRLLVRDDALGALVWLEGEDHRRLEVRGARRLAGGGWADPVTLAPRGPGSQLALTAVTLDDGSWLLAWSSYDGEDNEILWTRWHGIEASPPQRLAADNQVPDITPHLMATRSGALAVWSRYDGNDYRVMVAAFDTRRWSPPAMVGPRGSLYPTLTGHATAPLVIFKQAVPAAWGVTSGTRLSVPSRWDGIGSAPRQRLHRISLSSPS